MQLFYTSIYALYPLQRTVVYTQFSESCNWVNTFKFTPMTSTTTLINYIKYAMLQHLSNCCPAKILPSICL